MMSICNIEAEIKLLPIHEYAFLKSEDLVFSEEVRILCEKNQCGMYGTCWACPPAIGSIEECRKQCMQYEDGFLFTTATKVKNRFDMQGWLDARKEHEKLTDQVVKIFRAHYKDLLILSTEGCMVCKNCTYPDEPCRFPDRMYPATEGYGILVMQQAKLCSIKYNNGPNTVTYFSLILFNRRNNKEGS
ncbi:MAG: DUF2284 domain-containing protein [Firmicutes bacterium]|nr:DUF2284 domain-containing protein [Bacillota bacterium]